MKCCTVCGVEKDLACFSAQAKGKFGVTSICKPCTSERGKRWHASNRERSLASKKAYMAANREAVAKYSKEWRAANAGRSKELAAAWAANNPDKKRAAAAKRRAVLLQAIPAWASMDEIARFYVLADRLTAETGIKAQVDHIVPLQSPLVCGLHCAANLSVLSEAHNKRKGNLYWPDMPEPVAFLANHGVEIREAA